jgi:D-alanine--D-alanine ligase
MYKTRVGVLRGGPSAEYNESLQTGQSVLQNLSREKYEVKDILIDKNGKWHVRGFPVEPTRALDQIDVVFNALHGLYGEDGEIQRMFDAHKVRYTGSGSLSSALAMHKGLARTCLKNAPYKHPTHRVLSKEETSSKTILDLFQTFPHPAIVKPVNGGSSVGTSVVFSFDDLVYALTLAFQYAEQVLIEKYIRGREVTVTVVDGFRGEELYAFPPVEIVIKKNSFFEYAEKYDDSLRRLCPAPFPHEITRSIIDSAKHVHKTLGLRDYSRSDFIVAPDGIYFLEVNSLPGLTSTSLVPRSLEAVGVTLSLFLEHVVERANMRR